MVGTAERQAGVRRSEPVEARIASRGRTARGTVLLTGITLLPLAVAFCAFFTGRRGRIVAWGDAALLELSVRDVGSHVLLLGPYSRFRWHHPGPLIFDWLAIPYRLLGSATHGVNQGALLTAAISIGIVAWVAMRRGGIPLVTTTMIVVGLYVWAVGPDVMRSAWNPWITVLPFLAVLALAWNATAGELWAFPFAVAGGSFVVESHIGYAGVTLAVLGGAAVLILVIAQRSVVSWRRVLIVGAVSVVVLGVLWSPPLYQQLRDPHGNITQLQEFFSDAHSEHDIGDGIHVTLQELGVVPAQVTSLTTGDAQQDRPASWVGGITLLALAAAIGISVVRRSRIALCLAALVTLSMLAAVWSVANVIGPIESYLVLWIATVGAAAWIALGAALFAPGARPPAFHLSPAAALVPIALLAAVNSWSAWQVGPMEAGGTQAVSQLTRAVHPALRPPSDGPVLVRPRGAGSWALAAGVMLDLERRGYTTLVEPDQGWLLGDLRVRRPGERVAATLTFADPTSADALDAAGLHALAREHTIFDVSVFLQQSPSS